MRVSKRIAFAMGMAALATAVVVVNVSVQRAKAVGIITSDMSTGLTATDLASALVGSGVTVSNATYVGANPAAGTFSGGTGIIGFDGGVILGSGNIAFVAGPNASDSSSLINGTAGDAELTTLAGAATHDAAVLEFDFVPAGGVLQIDYVFASDEYNEFVNQFNDAFAFYVNGANCALVPGTSTPVTISTINNGNPFGAGAISNPEYYRNNDLTDGGPTINTGMDGLTTVLTCTAAVNVGVTNHMKLAIADARDSNLDTNVFLSGGSLAIPTATPIPDTPTDTATVTPIPPTATATSTPTVTSTSTSTSVPATGTATSTLTAPPTSTATNTPTSTALPATGTATNTAVPASGTATAARRVRTHTPVPTETGLPDTATSIPTMDEPPASGAIEVDVTVIHPSGGEVTATTGENVTFPPGGVDVDTVVTLRIIDSGDAPPPPDGTAFVGNVAAFDGAGAPFDPPAVITFPYDPSYVVDPATLGIWVVDDGEWRFLGGTVDTTTHTVSVNVVEGAMYALLSRPFAKPPQAGAGALPDTGGGSRNTTAAGWMALLALTAWLSGAMMVAGWRRRRPLRNER